ncbi:MAG: hypothetical protein KDC95_20800 [Planctomycetes bacterium]|nr:hypothetical protein [Planctomycetota bacterium]
MTVLLASDLSRCRATLQALGREVADFVEACAKALPKRISPHDAGERLEAFSELLKEFDAIGKDIITNHRPRGDDLRTAVRMLKAGRELRRIALICQEISRNDAGKLHELDRDVAIPLARATMRTASLFRNGLVATIAEDEGNVEVARLQFGALVDLLAVTLRRATLCARRDPCAASACLRTEDYAEQLERIGEVALRLYGFESRIRRMPIIPISEHSEPTRARPQTS